MFKTDTPTLGAVKRQYGDKFINGYIKIWIINLVEFLNIGKNMKDEQITETAEMIFDDYVYLTLADISLVFKRAKRGYYGKVYDRLDGQIILDWFSQYHDERCRAAQDISISEKSSHSDRSERSADAQMMRINQFEKPTYKRIKFNK